MMTMLHRPIRILSAAFVLLTIPGMAQSRFDVPLTTGAPSPQGPVFADQDAVSWTGNGEIHTVFGLQLPSAAVHQSTTPAGALAMAGGWTRLGESTALYLSTSGQLVLVRNLPNLPSALGLINTGLTASSAEFISWGENRAVLVDTAMPGFVVLTHGASGATLNVVASPVALTAPGSSYEWGVAYNGHFFGHGPGADAMAAAPLAVDVAPFAPGTVVYISVSDLIFSVPIPMSAGTGQAVLDFSGLPVDVAGLSFYLQALFYEPTYATFLVSDAFLVVVG